MKYPYFLADPGIRLLIILLVFTSIIATILTPKYTRRCQCRTLTRSHAVMWRRQECLKKHPCVYCHMNDKGATNVPDEWARHDDTDHGDDEQNILAR